MFVKTEAVIAVIAEVLDRPMDGITEHTSLRQGDEPLALDEIDVAEIEIAIEDEFDVFVDCEKFGTVGDLVEAIEDDESSI